MTTEESPTSSRPENALVLAPLLGLLVLGADVGVHVEELDQIDADTARALLDALGSALAPLAPVVAIDAERGPCGPDLRCLEPARARTDARELVLLKAYGGPTRIRVLAERRGPGANGPLRGRA